MHAGLVVLCLIARCFAVQLPLPLLAQHAYSASGSRFPAVTHSPFSSFTPKPGAACSLGSGGNRSSFVIAIGPGSGSFSASCALKKAKHPPHQHKTRRPSRPSGQHKLQYAGNADVARFVRHIQILDVRHVRRFRDVYPVVAIAVVSYFLPLFELSSAYPVALYPLPFLMSRVRVFLFQHSFILRIVNRNQRPLAQLPSKQRKPQSAHCNRRNHSIQLM